MSDRFCDARVERLFLGIEQSGFAVLDLLSLEDFLAICAAAGDVLLLQNVALIPGTHNYVSGSGPIPFHSDGPEPDLVGWFCVRQDERDGASLLLDASGAISSLPRAVKDSLASIQLPYFDKTAGGRPKGYAPILCGGEETGWRLNYAPWLLPALDDVQREAIAAFQIALSELAPIRIRLATGQCLFIDNRAILHGRGALRPDSSRLLRRAWLRTHRAMPPVNRIGEGF